MSSATLKLSASRFLEQVLDEDSAESRRIAQWREHRSGYQAHWSRSKADCDRDPVRCRLDALITAQGQLGPLVRVAVLIRDTSFEGSDLDALEHKFFRVRSGHPIKGADVLEPCRETRWLADRFNHQASRVGLPQLSFDDLMLTPVLPLDPAADANGVGGLNGAIRAYEHWLAEGWAWVSPEPFTTASLASPEAVEVAEAHPLVKEAFDKVCKLAKQPGYKRRPIVQCHAAHHPGLMRALVACLHAVGDQLPPLIVLDASPRLDADEDYGKALSASRQRPVTMRSFLEPLARCFGLDLGPSWQGLSGTALVSVLEVLRQGLAQHSCLVVVMGLANGGRSAADFVTGAAAYIDAIASLALPSIKAPQASATLFLTCAAEPVVAWTGYSAALFDMDQAEATAQALIDRRWVSGSRRGYRLLPCYGGAARKLIESVASQLPNRPPSDLSLALVEALELLGVKPTQFVLDDRCLMLLWLQTLQGKNPALLWLLALTSITQEGLSLATLDRVARGGMELLAANKLIDARSRKALVALLASLGGGQPDLDFPAGPPVGLFPALIVAREQAGDHLSERVQRWEIGHLGERSTLSSGTGVGGFRQVLRFAWPALRDRARQGLRELDRLWDDRLALLDYAVAIEAFHQASALLAHAAPLEQMALERKRLLMQSLLHLCEAGDLRGRKLTDGYGLGLASSPFPASSERRWRFAYAVLYRQLLEDRGAWVLSRRFAQPWLRLDALQALARWGGDLPLEALLPELARSPQRFKRQLVGNIAYAATESQQTALAELADKSLEAASPLAHFGSMHRVQVGTYAVDIRIGNVTTQPPASSRLAFARLDDAGKPGAAEALCVQAINGLAPKLLRRIHRLGWILEKFLMTEPDTARRFYRAYAWLNNRLVCTEAQADTVLDIADWMIRLADVRANAADDVATLGALIPAWLTFLSADRLRVLVGEGPFAQGHVWGRLNARYYRSGIRLSLKLARALHDTPGARDDAGLKRLSAAAMQFAGERIAILARDYNALAAERFHVTLLRGAQVRTACRIAADAALLPDVRDYLREAEEQWVELGSPTALTRRLLLERLSYREACLHFEGRSSAAGKAHLSAAKADLELLRGFVETAGGAQGFWKRWMARHERRLR